MKPIEPGNLDHVAAILAAALIARKNSTEPRAAAELFYLVRDALEEVGPQAKAPPAVTAGSV